jgi:LysR family transcriptional regulator, glycine cleavage system transcriptional activator
VFRRVGEKLTRPFIDAVPIEDTQANIDLHLTSFLISGEEKSPMDSLPSLNAIRAFEAAARLGSFAKAASELHVTHWAIGKQIRVLEDWMGRPLFRRLPRGIVLTDEGTELANQVSSAFSTLAAAVRRLRSSEAVDHISGIVRISVPTSFALRWLIPRLPQFQQQFPSITLRISTTSRTLRYIGSAFDFGIRLSPDPTLRSVKLMTDRRLPACTPAVLRAGPIASVQDLRRHTLIHSATTAPAWSEWLRLAGVPQLRPLHHMEFEHVHLQIEAAVNGLGIALVSLPLIQADLAAGRLICPFSKPEWAAQDYLLVSEHRKEDAAARAFRSWILDNARTSAPGM